MDGHLLWWKLVVRSMTSAHKIPCPHAVKLVGVNFPCQLDLWHWGKCLHDLVCNDTTLTWFPTQEERQAILRKIVHETQERRSDA